MKHLIVMLLLLLPVPTRTLAQDKPKFDDFFIDSTLRIDYYHTGDKSDEIISLDLLYRQGSWAGNPGTLIDPFSIGRYCILVYDAASNKLIYSKSFNSYFGEYQTTEPAKTGVKRMYHESALIPYPKFPILFVIERRDRNNLYAPLFVQRIDPRDYHILRKPAQRGDQVFDVVLNGDPHHKVDIVIVAEGYTAAEKPKFEKDLRRFADVFFSWEPYASLKTRFNIRGVFSPSPESGVDEPRQGVYKHTLLGATFNALDSDRYLLTEDNKTLRDIAAQVPYDAVLIMVNSKRYGGGGIYNFYTAFTSDGSWNEYVFHHEFGHAFAGLGDEYYSSDVSYEQFYQPGVEPAEPNITALLNPAQLKWKHLVADGTPIPTPWGKEQFDSLNTVRDTLAALYARQREQALKHIGSELQIKAVDSTFSRKLKDINDHIKRFMMDHPLRSKVGAFEGAGYMTKGFYRPTVNSLMNQFNEKDRSFYPVNEEAIVRVIRSYTE